MKFKNQWYKKLTLVFLFIVLFVLGVVFDKLFISKYGFNASNISASDNNKVVQSPIVLKENESDKSFSQAMELKNGYETQADLNSGSDADFYFFKVEKPSNVRIAFKDISYEYSVFIYDNNKLAIASSTRKGFTASAGLLSIKTPGKYYIEVLTSKNGSKITPYSVTLNILPIN